MKEPLRAHQSCIQLKYGDHTSFREPSCDRQSMADSPDPSIPGRESTTVTLEGATLSPSNAFEPQSHRALEAYQNLTAVNE